MKSNNERINEEIDELKRMGFIVSWFDRLKLNKLLTTNTINNIIMPLREMWAEPKIKLQYAREIKKQQKYFYAADFFLSKKYNTDDIAVKKNYRISKVLKVYEQQTKLEAKLYKGIIEFERKLKINLELFFSEKISNNIEPDSLMNFIYKISSSKDKQIQKDIKRIEDSISELITISNSENIIKGAYMSDLRLFLKIILYSNLELSEKNNFLSLINKDWILINENNKNINKNRNLILKERNKTKHNDKKSFILKTLALLNYLRNILFHAGSFQEFLNEARLKDFKSENMSRKNISFAHLTFSKNKNILFKKFSFLKDVELVINKKTSSTLEILSGLIELLNEIEKIGL